VVPEAFRGRREEIDERMKRSRLLARTPFRDSQLRIPYRALQHAVLHPEAMFKEPSRESRP
jgi:hypothetical protein